MKRGNIARTFLIILGVMIALYLSISSGVLSTNISPSLISPMDKSLALEEAQNLGAPTNIWSSRLKDAGEQIFSLLDLRK